MEVIIIGKAYNQINTVYQPLLISMVLTANHSYYRNLNLNRDKSMTSSMVTRIIFQELLCRIQKRYYY